MKVSALFSTPPPADLAPPPKPDPTGAHGLFSPAEANKYAIVAAGFHSLERQLQAITITDSDSAANVQRGLSEVARALKTADQTRLDQTKPFREKEATINEAWRPVIEGLKRIKAMADRKLIGWNEAERKRLFAEEQAARQAAEEALRKAEDTNAQADEVAAQAALAVRREAEAAVVLAPRGIRTESGTTSTQWRWTFKVTDAEKVPRLYLIADEKAIRAAIAAGVREIPGVYIWQEETLRTVTR